MANQTNAQRIAELEADRVRVRTAIASAQSGGAVQSFSLGDMSVNNGSALASLRAELNQIDKSLQRLYRGGRGMQVDVSGAAAASGDGTVIHGACGLPL